MSTEHRQKRSRGLKLAALTSLVAKGGNIVLQFIAIPMALVVLGKEEYGVFATISAFITFVMLTELGVGPGLTNIIAKKIANDDKEGASVAFSTAFLLTTMLAALGCALLITIVLGVPIDRLFGEKYLPYAAPIQEGVVLGVSILFIKMLTSVGDRARAAYQQTFVTNLYGAASNLTAGLLLIFGIHYFPKIWFLILCVNGCATLAALANSVHLFIQHPHLFPRIRKFHPKTASFLIKDGLAFCATMSLAPFAKDLGLRLLLGHLGGPAVVAVFDILERLMIFVYGFVVMFTVPLWPALSDAAARQDFAWIRSARSRLYMAAVGYGILFTIGLTFLGPWGIQIWLKGHVSLEHMVLFAFSVYLSISVWQHVHHIFLAGLDSIRIVAAIVLLELPVFLAAGFWGYVQGGFPGLYFGLAVASVVSAIILPLVARKRMNQLENQFDNRPTDPPTDQVIPSTV